MENKSFGKKLLRLLSYVLVAALASMLTQITQPESKLEELERVLENNFVAQVDTAVMEDTAAAAMVYALGDRWSYYIPADQYQIYEDGKRNSYVGIGVTVTAREDGVGLDVIRVEPNSGAKEAGILPGDILVSAQGQSLEGMDAAAAATYIKGEAGQSVRIVVLRDGQELSFDVMRQMVQTLVATGQMLDGDIGYIKIANFNERCAQETLDLVRQMEERGAKGLIFDLRNNPGGYRDELVKILDYLLPEGPLFRSVSAAGEEAVDQSDAACLELPMAVLVNSESYSASEFFAAALHEYDWGIVVGTPTVGKGYYQNTIKLSDGSAVGLSVGAYYTPKGVSLAEVGGLVPDVTVEVDEQMAEKIYTGIIEPMDDPQVLAALQALK